MEQLTGLKAILHSKRANIYYLEHCRVMQLYHNQVKEKRSLPHRQFRKRQRGDLQSRRRSLPHRQLRNEHTAAVDAWTLSKKLLCSLTASHPVLTMHVRSMAATTKVPLRTCSGYTSFISSFFFFFFCNYCWLFIHGDFC